MSISDALARKLATYVVLQKRVEDRAVAQIMEVIERLWADYERRAKRFGETTPLDILLYEFQVLWKPTKRVAEFNEWLVNMMNELGRGAVVVTVDEVLRYRPDLKQPLNAALAQVFQIYGQPGSAIFTGTAGGYTIEQTLERFFQRLGLDVEDSLRAAWAKSFHDALMAGLAPGQAAAEAFRVSGIDWQQVEERLRRNTWQVERIVRTHSMAAVNMAQHLFCTALAKDGLVVGERWVATPDIVTCPECAALDGQVWYFQGEPNIDERPSLPRHPNCRCTIVPVLAPEYDPEPVKVFTYEEWFGGLSEQQQRAILGDTGYQAWRGGLSLREALLGRLTVTDVMSVADVAEVVAESLTTEVPPGPRFRELWGEVTTGIVGDLTQQEKAFDTELATVATNYLEQLKEVWPTLPTQKHPVGAKMSLTPWRRPEYGGIYEFRQNLIVFDVGGIADSIGVCLQREAELKRAGEELPRKDSFSGMYREELVNPHLYMGYIVRHELAHHLDFIFAHPDVVLGYSKPEAFQEFARLMGTDRERVMDAHYIVRSLLKDPAWVVQNISEYAARNEYELFAEAVAMYTSPFYDDRLPKNVEEALDFLLGGRARVEYIRAITAKLAAMPVDLKPLEERYL